MSDKRILHIISASTLVALLVSFLFGEGGRIAAALLTVAICAVTMIFVKKRGIPNFVYPEVALLMGVIAAVYVMLYYLTGLQFGIVKTHYGTFLEVVVKYILPISVIIISTELVRNVMCAQEDRAASLLSYVSCVIADVIIHYTLPDIFSFSRFMDIIALAFLPAVLSNLLYHYLSRRYGIIPNVAYRLIITLYPYVISYVTGIPDSLLAFVNLLLPLFVYLFIDYLYEKKKRYAISRNSKLGIILTAVIAVMMAGVILVVSNTTRFGAYVIASESMTGELNKGDIALYEQYDDQVITEGQVIVFKKDNRSVIHRVAEIANINGQNRYYTKGDMNSDLDWGYITDGDIVGLVDFKLPYFGYPTLWLREWIKNIL